MLTLQFAENYFWREVIFDENKELVIFFFNPAVKLVVINCI